MPINQDENGHCDAAVFLILKAPERTILHKLQYTSVEILDENNKKEEEIKIPKRDDESSSDDA